MGPTGSSSRIIQKAAASGGAFNGVRVREAIHGRDGARDSVIGRRVAEACGRRRRPNSDSGACGRDDGMRRADSAGPNNLRELQLSRGAGPDCYSGLFGRRRVMVGVTWGSQGEARSCGHPGGSVRAGSVSKAMRNSRTATVQGTCWCGVHAYAGGSVRYARLYAGKVRMARPFRYSWAKGPQNRRHRARETVPASPFVTIATADMRGFANEPLTRLGGGSCRHLFFSHVGRRWTEPGNLPRVSNEGQAVAAKAEAP